MRGGRLPYKLAVSLFIVSLLGAQLWAIQGPHEDWPFGANVMFAYDVGLDSNLYDVTFLVRPLDGAWKQLRTERDLRMRDVILKRKFFSQYFVSDNPQFAQRPPAGSPPKSRRERLEVFAKKVAEYLEMKGHPIDALRIELARLGPTYQPQDRRVIFELNFKERN
jgi:hypothetical protein